MVECVLGVPVPYKRDRSLITWDRSQNDGFYGTGPITLFIIQFNGLNYIFLINVVLFRLENGLIGKDIFRKMMFISSKYCFKLCT